MCLFISKAPKNFKEDKMVMKINEKLEKLLTLILIYLAGYYFGQLLVLFLFKK